MILTEGGSYYNSMDHMETPTNETLPGSEELGVIRSIKNIGPSKWLSGRDADPVQGLMAEIKKGASTIEITAPGAGRGDQGNPTFEYIDKGKAEEMRTLAKINQVNITTHSTPSAWGIAGFDGRSEFSKAQQAASIQEIRKAIDFSTSVANGGSVVIHTGEFPRPFTSHDISRGDFQFRQFEGEEKEENYYLVNRKDGRLIQSVKRDEFVFVPVQETNPDGSLKWILDDQGKQVPDDITHQPIPVYKWDEKDQAIQVRKLTFDDFATEERKKNPALIDNVDVAKKFFLTQLQSQIGQNLGQARQYESQYIHGLKARDEMLEDMRYLRGLKERLPKDEWERMKSQLTMQMAQRHGRGYRPSEGEDPITAMNTILTENVKEIAYGREISTSGRRQAMQQLEEYQKNVESMEKYAIEQSAKGYADLALYAMDKSKHTTRPIKLTLENVYPQTYGSTADEIINVVTESRKAFAKRLMQERKMSQDEANTKAKEHIAMTLDTGHLNMWRKHFQQKPGETPDGADQRFKKWYLEEIEKMAKAGIVGHVHLADNFGYDDSHLVVGQGNVPIKEVMGILDKHGFKDKIAVEGGFNQGREGFLDVWRLMGSPIYGVGKPGSPVWSNIQQGHFGYSAPPNYIVGAYAPSNEWKFWSEVPFE